MSCACRCHVYGPSSNVSCDMGPEQPGGQLSCTPIHDDSDEVPLDEACVLGHPEPVAREFGYACRRHYHWIDRTLQQIEELFALIDEVLIPQLSVPLDSGPSGTQTGSPSPGRIDIMAITDRRVAGLKIPMTPYLNDDHRGGMEPNGDDTIDVPGILAGWARIVVEERPTTDQLDGTVTGSVRLLRRERLWIAQQPWLDDYVGELHDVHLAVAHAVGDSMWPRPIGHCPNCAAPMYPTIGLDVASCRRCKTTWRGVALARLRLIHEQEGAAR